MCVLIHTNFFSPHPHSLKQILIISPLTEEAEAREEK